MSGPPTTIPARGTTLQKRYQRTGRLNTDVREQLPYFVETVHDLDATTVIELGVRQGTSTIAWLYALEGRGHLWSVDILDEQMVGSYPHWTFIVGDDLDPTVREQLPHDADVVFIDTSHGYAHTLVELALYVPHVRPGGRVLLHDIDLEVADLDDPLPIIPFPVRRAVEDFCAEHGFEWTALPGGPGLAVVQL